MGKAGRWIRNFLMGKREEKKTGTFLPAEPCKMIVTHAPELRRRWSFRTSLRANTISHKSSISFDSILVPKQDTFEYETLRTMPATRNADAAATKIQAAYRSYLARRALRALKALVKLQALARGYLVRKQMNTILRSIRAVMAIQVRARMHRVQMADEPPVMSRRRKSYGEPYPSERQIRKEISVHTASGGLRSRSVHLDHVHAERLGYGSRICASGRLSVSQREYKMSPSPSTLSFTDSSSTTYDEHHSKFIPNYMAKTRSSEARTRSHSEPRQRPKLGTKQKSKRSSSMDLKNNAENQYPMINNTYHSHKYSDNDSYMRVMANVSQHIRVLTAYELPPMNLY